jgi:hypothetical protein
MRKYLRRTVSPQTPFLFFLQKFEGFECGNSCGGQCHRTSLPYVASLGAAHCGTDTTTTTTTTTTHTHTHTHTLHCRALMRYMYVNIYNFGCGHGCRSGCAWMWVCVGVMGVGVGAYHMSGLYISSYEWVAGRRG